MNLADRPEARGTNGPLDRCDSRDRGAMHARALFDGRRVYVPVELGGKANKTYAFL